MCFGAKLWLAGIAAAGKRLGVPAGESTLEWLRWERLEVAARRDDAGEELSTADLELITWAKREPEDFGLDGAAERKRRHREALLAIQRPAKIGARSRQMRGLAVTESEVAELERTERDPERYGFAEGELERLAQAQTDHIEALPPPVAT